MAERPRTGAEGERGFEADLELVRRVLSGGSGGAQALESFIERMRCVPRMLAAKNARLGHLLGAEELEDLAQDTLVSIWRRLDSFAGLATLETWAYTFCQLELANRLRARERRQRGVGGARELGHEAWVDGGEPRHDVLRTAFDYEHLHLAIERVGADDADVLRLKHFEELTFDEIGARLAISPNTAKTRYYRGIDRLRELLEPQHKEVGL
jgi:RNA polymerase sigma-70 factor (ECF subfamily)